MQLVQQLHQTAQSRPREDGKGPGDRERPVHTGSGPVALGDCCGGQSSSSSSTNSIGSSGRIIVIEGVRTDVERLLIRSSSSSLSTIAAHIYSGTTARTA